MPGTAALEVRHLNSPLEAATLKMQKIRCPRCGVVNLEEFVTYPQCAGCGSTLPLAAGASQSPPFWRRPLRPALWVSIVGGVLGFLIGAASLVRPAPDDRSQIVLYGDSTRRARVGQVVTLNLVVNALGESRGTQKQALRDVKLRLPLRVFRALQFVSIKPLPDATSIVGNGRYFHYQNLDHETVFRLRLRVTRAGQFRIPFMIHSAAHLPGQWRITIFARPELSPPKNTRRQVSGAQMGT
jgi:hypothetical protein